MSTKKPPALTKETLKDRSQICVYESNIDTIQIDSRVLSRLLTLGSSNSEIKSFAKLYGFFDNKQKQLNIKDSIALPCIKEDDQKKLLKTEAEEKNIRASLGYNYQFCGTFIVSENEDFFGENLSFYLTHYNVYQGFGVVLVYSNETAKTSQKSPIRAYMPSKQLSQCYKFKIDKELFEPDPAQLTKLIQSDTPLFTEVAIKTLVSPVLDLITARNQVALRSKNPITKSGPAQTSTISNLESSLSQTVHQMMNVLNSRRSFEMRRQHLLNFGGALKRMQGLLELKKEKLKNDEMKLGNLESLANECD